MQFSHVSYLCACTHTPHTFQNVSHNPQVCFSQAIKEIEPLKIDISTA